VANNLLEENLRIPELSNSEVITRKIVQPFLRLLPSNLRWRFSDLLRTFKNKKNKRKVEIKNFKKINWQKGIIGGVCLTHDIDYLQDYLYLPEIIKKEEGLGFFSTINFLTDWDYQLKEELLINLIKKGFEVGFHGRFHDICFGYRREEAIRNDLKKALLKFPNKVKGFRAPALSSTEKMLKILKEFGLEYDSSVMVASNYTKGVSAVSPYLYPEINIWEVPITIQDSILFRDFKFDQGTSLKITKDLIEKVLELNGVAVINLHPSLLKKNPIFWESLLNYLKSREKILILPISNLIDYIKKFN
jgi:peptidoglycan/xylan/chitin deacetylase (PgdA/CDA1 family)